MRRQDTSDTSRTKQPISLHVENLLHAPIKQIRRLHNINNIVSYIFHSRIKTVPLCNTASFVTMIEQLQQKYFLPRTQFSASFLFKT